MITSVPPFGIVVPVRNEAAALRETLPALLRALEGLPVRTIWVCNDCSDDSADVIRALAGKSAEILDLPHAGKTRALQAGDDALAGLFPRFYLDADVTFSKNALPALLRPLLNNKADLVAARRIHCTNGVSTLSAAMARTWDTLPYPYEAGFLGAVGLSEAGRSSWRRWPNILGDDVFVAANIPSHRRQMVTHVTASTRPPADFKGWVIMRARWRQGEEELRALGLVAPQATYQRSELLRQLFKPRYAIGAWAFVLARLVAPLVRGCPPSGWQPDRRGWL